MLAQAALSGAGEQSENSQHHECVVFARHSVGVDSTKPDHERTSECKKAGSARRADAGGTGNLAVETAGTASHRSRVGRLHGTATGQDVDFENLTIHVRRSVVMMVAGLPKTEASAKDVPLDATLAESRLRLRLSSLYNKPVDWVFASPRMKGKQPYWPDGL